MEEVGREERRFLANVGGGFLHILLNEPSPIDRPDIGNCPEQGVCHSNAELFRLLQTKDGQNEFDYSLPLRQFPG